MLQLGESGEYAAVKDDPVFKFDKAFTVEVWARPYSLQDRATIVEKGIIGDYTSFSMAVGSSNTIVGRMLGPSGAVSVQSQFISDLTAWHHYALVFKPNDSLYLFIDGERNAAVRAPGFVSSGSDSLRIGKSATQNGKAFNGSVDELRIWRVARTQTELKQSMAKVIPGNTADLVAYFTFDDESSGGRFYDNVRKGLIANLKQGAQLVPSSSPVTGNGTIYKLQVKEKELRLPKLYCGSSFDTVIRVRNLGLDSVNVNFMGLVRGTAFSIAGPERLVLPADSNFWGEIRIQFNPNLSGVYDDTVIVGSSSACAGKLKIPLIDTFISAEIQAAPLLLTQPSVLNCMLPLQQTVTVKNSGVTQVTVNSASFAADIGVRIPDGIIPFTLDPGASRKVPLVIDRFEDGLLETQLTFGIDKCQRTTSITVQVTRQSIEYDVPASVQYADKTLLTNQITIDTLIQFTNTGKTDVSIQEVSLPLNSPFTLREQIFRRGVGVGETIEIPIRFTTTTCGQFMAPLKIYGAPCNFDRTIPLSITVNSPRPTAQPVLDFGSTCSVKDTEITVTNPFDAPIVLSSVAIEPIGAFRNLDSFPDTIPAYGQTKIKVRFNAASANEYEAKLKLYNARCGVTEVKLIGGFGTTGVRWSQSSVDFGSGCEISPMMKQIRIANTSSRDVLISDTAVKGSGAFKFVDVDLPFVLERGTNKSFDVLFTPLASTTSRSFLSFVTSEGCSTGEVEVYGTRENPSLTLSVNALDFDTLCPGSQAVQSIEITNAGIDSLRLQDVEITGSPYFSIVNEPTSIPRGKSVLNIAFAPQLQGEYTGTAAVKIAGCNDVYYIQMRGVGGSNPTLSYSTHTLTFDNTRVGSTSERCVTLTNVSCSQLTLQKSSFPIDDPSFRMVAASEAQLPRTLNNGESISLCFVFEPQTRAVSALDIRVSVEGTEPEVLTLVGTGVAPEIAVLDTLLDFGFVPITNERTLKLRIENHGNAEATSALNVGSGVFMVAPSTITLQPGGGEDVVLTFIPDRKQLYEGTLKVEGGRDVLLRGFGTDRGIAIDRTVVEFGDVRVRASKLEEVTVTANTFPTTLSLIDFVESDASTHYSWKLVDASQQMPFTFHAADEELKIQVSFSPQSENELDRRLKLVSSEGEVILPLTGRGVDAHIQVTPSIDFQVVGFEDTVYKSYSINNYGGYPLTITNATTVSPFLTDAIVATLEPGETRSFEVGFAPRTDKQAVGKLQIVSDAVEGEISIDLRGRGGNVTQSKPRVAYSMPNIEAQIGSRVLIPIIVEGNQLEKITTDSFYIAFRYDPWMLYVYDFDKFATLSNGMTVESKRLDDSTIALVGHGALKLENGKSLIDLKGEALFGPREHSALQVIEAYPSTLTTLANATGDLYITNCKDQAAGAVYKGEYSVDQAYPNPVRDVATLKYKVGFTASAELVIHDDLGRVVKIIRAPEKPKGEHELVLDLSDLPNGHYTALFKSREFIQRIDMIVEH